MKVQLFETLFGKILKIFNRGETTYWLTDQVICGWGRKKYTNFGGIWNVKSHGIPQVSILGPLLFFLYINDLPKCTNKIANNNKTELILFPGDTNLIVTNPKHSESIKDIKVMFTKINNWFKANLLSLNFETTSFMPFLIKNSSNIDINIGWLTIH